MIDQQKKEIRKYIRSLKSQISLDEKKLKSKNIFEKVEKMEDFGNSKIIMIYWSMDDEVYTHDFILKWNGQKEIILPVVKGDNLELKKFTGMSNMETGVSFGIAEPTGEQFNESENIDIIIVPGVAFDRDNNRLGRGKAYYDKLLKTTGATKIGICFDFQLIDEVPVDEYDVKMDMVITNS